MCFSSHSYTRSCFIFHVWCLLLLHAFHLRCYLPTTSQGNPSRDPFTFLSFFLILSLSLSLLVVFSRISEKFEQERKLYISKQDPWPQQNQIHSFPYLIVLPFYLQDLRNSFGANTFIFSSTYVYITYILCEYLTFLQCSLVSYLIYLYI